MITITMNGTNLARIDANLLVALDVLLRERNVTRAGRRLAVSQSAMSHKLRHLRALFRDPLLVTRPGRPMALTPLAEALAAPLREHLGGLEDLVQLRAEFDPATSRRRFVLCGPDAVELALVPALMMRLRDEAPGVQIELQPWSPRRWASLETEPIDLLFAMRPEPGQGHLGWQPLLREGMVCLVRREHPALHRGRIAKAAFLRLHHVLVATGDPRPAAVDVALAEAGHTRHVALRLSGFAAAVHALVRSDLVLTASESLAAWATTELPLRAAPHPLPLPRLEVGVAWHQRLEADPGHRWLRSIIDRMTAARFPALHAGAGRGK